MLPFLIEYRQHVAEKISALLGKDRDDMMQVHAALYGSNGVP